MALGSVALEITLHQILEVPYASNVTTLDGFGNLGPNFTMTASATILAYVNGLNANTTTELTTLLTDWSAISTTPAKMEAGAVGSLSGLSFDYSQKRAHIAERIKTIVPFYRYHEILAKQNQAGSSSVEVIH